MGTLLTVTVGATTRQEALEATERAIRAVERTEARLSTWRSDSELAELNRAPVGAEMEISPELAADLGAAVGWSEATGGAFDPGIGALVAAWGLRGAGRLPDPAELAVALAGSGREKLEIAGRRVRRRHAGLVVEEGGFGKGVALDEALREAGRTRMALDFGGQFAVSSGPGVTVVIADPATRSEAVASLTIASGSIATSGNGERGLIVDGRSIGHIIDPRTGAPAPEFGSVTVWARSATAADCLSTGLYVMGPEGALRWAAAHPEIGVVVVEKVGGATRVRATHTMRACIAGRDVEFVGGVAAESETRSCENRTGRREAR
ncbi:MAG: FAD:protein FMN transferase [Acidobacteriota bacterium]